MKDCNILNSKFNVDMEEIFHKKQKIFSLFRQERVIQRQATDKKQSKEYASEINFEKINKMKLKLYQVPNRD